METALVPFDQIERMAAVMGRTGMFGKKPEELLPLMLIAQAEGKHPAIAAQEYDIIQGRPAINSKSALARFQAAGGRIQWQKRTDTEASATLAHPSGGELTVTWDMKRATQAGLTGKDTWKKYPAQMLAARVVAEGVRAVFPACLSGMYTSEEVQDMPPLPKQAELRNVTNEFTDPRVPAIYQQFQDYISTGLLPDKAVSTLVEAMEKGEVRIPHLEKMLARTREVHNEAFEAMEKGEVTQ